MDLIDKDQTTNVKKDSLHDTLIEPQNYSSSSRYSNAKNDDILTIDEPQNKSRNTSIKDVSRANVKDDVDNHSNIVDTTYSSLNLDAIFNRQAERIMTASYFIQLLQNNYKFSYSRVLKYCHHFLSVIKILIINTNLIIINY